MQTIYTDGCCWPNPGPGGWAFVCENTNYQRMGRNSTTTNNRMELFAVIAALDHVKSIHGGDSVLIVSDSEYVVFGCQHRLAKWKANDWKQGEIKNIDLWKQIDVAKRGLDVKFKWVRGHSGNTWNEHADRLAREALDSFSVKSPPPAKPNGVVYSSDTIAEGIEDLWSRGGFTPAFEKAVAEIQRLQAENERLRRGEFVCQKCSLRKDGVNDQPGDF